MFGWGALLDIIFRIMRYLMFGGPEGMRHLRANLDSEGVLWRPENR
jgi:hypothetical protein